MMQDSNRANQGRQAQVCDQSLTVSLRLFKGSELLSNNKFQSKFVQNILRMLTAAPTSIIGYNLGTYKYIKMIPGQELGAGAQATVYLASSPTGQLVAIKALNKSSPGFDLNAAKKEFKIHNSVKHQNIIKVFGCSENANHIFIILEYAAAVLGLVLIAG